MTILEKQPSPELLSLIKAAAQSLLGFGELWNSIKMKGKDEGFSERELQDILRPLLKPQLNKDQIYYLFNAEQKKEQSKEHYHRNIPTDDAKKVLEQIHIPPKELEQSPEDEEPTELELANIRITQLEDALHKTEQFKPATALQPQVDDINIVKIRAGIGGIENMIRLEIPKLRNSGWKTVEITMRAV
jgi:hypothetical protein